MSVTCRFPYALLQQIQNDLAALTQMVHSLQTQNNSDSVLLQSLQSTVDSISGVLSSAETSTSNMCLHPTFTDCTDFEHTLDSKLTVTPVYCASNRKNTLV